MYKTYRLIAQHIRDNIAEILWIDRDKGQLENPEKFHSIIVPGLLLNFGTIDWKSETKNNQYGEGSVTTKLIFRLPVATYTVENGADGTLMDYEEFEAISEALHQTVTSFPGVGVRRSGGDHFTSEFYVCEQTYDFTVAYYHCPITIPKPAPKIEGEISHTVNLKK